MQNYNDREAKYKSIIPDLYKYFYVIFATMLKLIKEFYMRMYESKIYY